VGRSLASSIVPRRTVALGVPLAEALDSVARARAGGGHRRRSRGAPSAPPATAPPLGPNLAAQAAEARSRTARRHTETAARAAPQVQLVVALLLVPSVLLFVAAALIPA
jgi:tight adherence protein C